MGIVCRGTKGGRPGRGYRNIGARKDGGLGQGGSNGGGRSGQTLCILKVEPLEFPNRLDMDRKERKESKMIIRFLD